jgi:hypothetical protein
MFVRHDENRQREINILRKTAGAGNYTIYYMDEYGEIARVENGEEN